MSIFFKKKKLKNGVIDIEFLYFDYMKIATFKIG